MKKNVIEFVLGLLIPLISMIVVVFFTFSDDLGIIRFGIDMIILINIIYTLVSITFLIKRSKRKYFYIGVLLSPLGYFLLFILNLLGITKV